MRGLDELRAIIRSDSADARIEGSYPRSKAVILFDRYNRAWMFLRRHLLDDGVSSIPQARMALRD